MRNLRLLRRQIVLRAEQTKTAHGRVVPLSRALIRALAAQLRERRRTSGRLGPSDYVIVNPVTKQPYKDVYPWFTGACARAGIENFHFHDTRHHFASTYVQRGGRLQTLANLLGHTSVRMTERYAHLAPSDAEAEFRRIERGSSDRS